MDMAQTMRAAILDSTQGSPPAPLSLEQVSMPQLNPGEVLLRVRACGVCRTDIHIIERELPVLRPRLIPGHQIVGEIAGGATADLPMGTRVGVSWLGGVDGACPFCRMGEENLCDAPTFTGYSVDGGYAEYVVAPGDFVYAIPDGFTDEQAAPLLRAGIIGFRCLRLSGIKPGGRLGFYGFGAAAHIAIQVARHWNVTVYASTRDARHQKLAMELGGAWAGGTLDAPPEKLDAAIVFAPAGEIVPAALATLRKGGVLVLGGIHMSAIPSFSYDLLYQERVIRSVANNTRQDGEDFLRVAAEIPVRMHTQVFPLSEANRALNALKNDAIEGAAVLRVSG